MPRTPTLMSSARLLVVRRAFLVLDARWTMAKKTFSRLLPPSFSLSLFLSMPPSLSILFRLLSRSTGKFPRSGNPSVVFYHSPVCWLS